VRSRRSSHAWIVWALGLLLPAACGAATTAAPAPARLPAGADAFLAAIRSARAAYAYRLNTAGGLLGCDSLEAPEAGQGCPEVARKWGPVAASWVDSLARLLSQPETYRGSERDLVSYPDLALRFEGEGAWVELILNTGYRQFWMRSPGRAPVPGLYDRALDPMCSLIRGLLPPDMALDSSGVLAGPGRVLAGDYPNRGVAVEYEEAPDRIYSVEPRCPGGLGRPCAGDSVRLQLWVGKNGRIHAVLPVAGDSLLVRAASEAAGQWIYRPAQLKRRPVATWIDIWVRFPPSR
jgi:hypothetical protein